MELNLVKKKALGILMAAVVAALLSCSSAIARPPSVATDLITPGTLNVGSDIPYPPFEFRSDGEYDGFDIDLVKALAKKLRLKVDVEDTAFDTIFTDLSQGDFDLVASATTITPERARVVKFTKPIYDPQQSLVTSRGSGIRSIRDLAGAKVGVQRFTSGADFAENRTNSKRVIDYRNGQAVIRALRRGKVDAIIIDQPVIYFELAKKPSGLRVVRNFSTGELYGYAVKKSSKSLLRGVNWAIDKVKADGTFRNIYRRWFGINPPSTLFR